MPTLCPKQIGLYAPRNIADDDEQGKSLAAACVIHFHGDQPTSILTPLLSSYNRNLKHSLHVYLHPSQPWIWNVQTFIERDSLLMNVECLSKNIDTSTNS
jgi:hypothetical protein